MEHLTQLRQTRPWTAVHGDGPHDRDLGVADRERPRRGAYRSHAGHGEVYPDLCIPSCLHDEDVRVLAIQEADERAQAKLTISTLSGTVITVAVQVQRCGHNINLPYVSVQLLDRRAQRGLDVTRGDGMELVDGAVLH